MNQGIRRRLWVPEDAKLAQRVADIVSQEPQRCGGWLSCCSTSFATTVATKLTAFAEHCRERRYRFADELDRLCQCNPCCFQFVADPSDGIDRVTLRSEPGPADVQARLEDMRHFQRVAPQPEPYARARVKHRPGWCWSCGDPLAAPDTVGRCGLCAQAARIAQRQATAADVPEKGVPSCKGGVVTARHCDERLEAVAGGRGGCQANQRHVGRTA